MGLVLGFLIISMKMVYGVGRVAHRIPNNYSDPAKFTEDEEYANILSYLFVLSRFLTSSQLIDSQSIYSTSRLFLSVSISQYVQQSIRTMILVLYRLLQSPLYPIRKHILFHYSQAIIVVQGIFPLSFLTFRGSYISWQKEAFTKRLHDRIMHPDVWTMSSVEAAGRDGCKAYLGMCEEILRGGLAGQSP